MNIYVGNLPYGMNDNGLQGAFESYGTVQSASVILDKFSGKSRGFGFVDMPDSGEAKAAIEEMNGKDFEGRALVVNEARPRTERPAGGGGGGGRGGGGSRGGDRGGRGRSW
ncbi:MAG: RNA-binding protein [Kiritimatiellae bacterium]|nr:RNA-binding protein [Kiritimatiellia bacterium]